MRDIPVFTTSAGAASLFLRRIPFTRDAYIKLQDSLNPEQLLEECCEFCRLSGAERIYACGQLQRTDSPYASIYEMTADVNSLPPTDGMLYPVQENTFEAWRTIYNGKMQSVFYAALIGTQEKAKLLKEGGCYFVHKDSKLLGIGKIADGEVMAVASAVPGKGGDVLSALASALGTDTVKVTVSNTNQPAMKLYERLGFVRTALVSQWYQIL